MPFCRVRSTKNLSVAGMQTGVGLARYPGVARFTFAENCE